MSILQFNGRIYVKGSLPRGFNAETFAEQVHQYIHGVLIPSHGMEAREIDETEPPTLHIHASTEYDSCSGCMSAAQDGEN